MRIRKFWTLNREISECERLIEIYQIRIEDIKRDDYYSEEQKLEQIKRFNKYIHEQMDKVDSLNVMLYDEYSEFVNMQKVPAITKFMDNYSEHLKESFRNWRIAFAKWIDEQNGKINNIIRVKYGFVGSINPASMSKEDYEEYSKLEKEMRIKIRSVPDVISKYYKSDKINDFNKELEIVVKEIRDEMEYKLYQDVIKETGVIKDANLYVGESGELAGTVIGEKAKVNLWTTGSGGFNIQRFHFRHYVRIIEKY